MFQVTSILGRAQAGRVRALALIVGFCITGWANAAGGAPGDAGSDLHLQLAQSSAAGFSDVEVHDDYALGINRFQLDTHTEIIGWRLRQSLYFGRQDGLDSGLTLVWQQSEHQVSLSKDGLRLTRRF